jgi:uncharacterized protein (TIGR00661 family)
MLNSTTLSFVFIVQGEGRGHMTQALAMENLLMKHGHQVLAVLVGKSDRRIIPSFFIEKCKAPLHFFLSPNFETDTNQQGIHWGKTIVGNLRKFNRFQKSLNAIETQLESLQPDVVLNFYELLCGIHFALKPRRYQHWCIGHQYLMLSKSYQFPQDYIIEKMMLVLNTRLTAYGATYKIALSFEPLNQVDTQIVVMPPLLREAIFEQKSEKKPFVLVYMVNAGYASIVEAWHAKNPQIALEVFSDRKDIEGEKRIDETLTFHSLNDQKFIQKMASCSAFVSSAGFESVAEAAYLEKPMLLVPTGGQFEQSCNALDAAAAGLAIWDHTFRIEKVLPLMEQKKLYQTYQLWVESFEPRFLQLLTGISRPQTALSIKGFQKLQSLFSGF